MLAFVQLQFHGSGAGPEVTPLSTAAFLSLPSSAGKFALVLMFTAGMSQEQLLAALQTQAGEMAQMRGIIDQLNVQQQQQTFGGAAGAGTGGKGGGKGNGDERGRALLNRKDFGLVDKFEGNQSKFKRWLFDLLTALGSMDQALATETKQMLQARPEIVMEEGAWDVPQDVAMDFPNGQSPSNHKKV